MEMLPRYNKSFREKNSLRPRCDGTVYDKNSEVRKTVTIGTLDLCARSYSDAVIGMLSQSIQRGIILAVGAMIETIFRPLSIKANQEMICTITILNSANGSKPHRYWDEKEMK